MSPGCRGRGIQEINPLDTFVRATHCWSIHRSMMLTVWVVETVSSRVSSPGVTASPMRYQARRSPSEKPGSSALPVAPGAWSGIAGSSAPQLADRQAATLDGLIGPEAFAPLLAGSFARLLELWRTSESSALVRAWEERAHLPGTRLTVHVGKDETVTGRFAGLEQDGALRLMRDDGELEIIRAGDVEL